MHQRISNPNSNGLSEKVMGQRPSLQTRFIMSYEEKLVNSIDNLY